jgi:hypothetical protein
MDRRTPSHGIGGLGSINLHHRPTIFHDVDLRNPVRGLVRVRIRDRNVELEVLRLVERRTHDGTVDRIPALDVPIKRGIGPPVLHGIENACLGLRSCQFRSFFSSWLWSPR